MVFSPKPRTAPTVKQTRNISGDRRKFEVKLGFFSTLLLLIVTLGGIAGAFYLGMLTGHHAGFETALASSSVNVAKFPIVARASDVVVEDNIENEIFHKLENPDQRTLNQDQFAGVKEEPLPELEEIHTKEISEVERVALPSPAPVVNETAPGEIFSRNSVLKDVEAKVVVKEDPEIGLEPTQIITPNPTPVRGGTLVPSVPKIEKEIDQKIIESISSVIPSQQLPKPAILAATPTLPPTADNRRAVSAFIKPSLPKGWVAQVAAPREIKDAEELVLKLKESGFPAIIENATVNGQEYYRVLVGPEDDRALGNELINQLRREPYIRGEPFLKLIR